MRLNKINQLFLGFLLVLFLINLVQSIFTGIHYDEAYYAIWGRELALGYFDHPPAVAVLTYLGSLFFDGNLSVRFFTILLHLCTVSLIWFSIDEKYKQTSQSVKLFFLLVIGFVMFSVYGFTTTPDVPLMFFVALFLFYYKRFLERETWLSALGLSVAMAGMLYSKYHGGLFIAIVIISNLKLLTKFKFWVAGILALVLLIPHFYWQYSTDFTSFKFHLVSRSLGFQVKYLLEFLPGQLGVFNPFIFGAIIFVLWKLRPKNDFERTLYFLIIGIIGFFAISTYRGRAEAHWTSMASIPMIILLMQKVSEHKGVERYLLKYASWSLVLVFIARGILFTDIAKKFGYEDREYKYREIERVAGNTPVVFNSSFQDASLYHFYTKKLSTTISAIENRQTQFDIWQKDQKIQDQKVFVVLGKGLQGDSVRFKKYDLEKSGFIGFFVEDWQISNRLKIYYHLDKQQFKAGEEVEIPITIENPTRNAIDFQHRDFPLDLKVVFLILKREYIIENAEFSQKLGVIKPLQTIKGKLKFRIPKAEARGYKFAVITNSFFGHTLNSPFESIEIKE